MWRKEERDEKDRNKIKTDTERGRKKEIAEKYSGPAHAGNSHTFPRQEMAHPLTRPLCPTLSKFAAQGTNSKEKTQVRYV